ncbi:unnamed protein product [Symbiodinium sp. CCMP2456]|nr:unnamed protein product [Symbiodinium sp. CCMP2456]
MLLKPCSNRHISLSAGLAMINNLNSVIESLELETAFCHPGHEGENRPVQRSREFGARGEPCYRIIREYLVLKVEALMGCVSSSKGERTNVANFAEALDHAELKLFKQIDAACFCKLLVNAQSFPTCMPNIRGSAVFGKDGGCPFGSFDLLHMQEKLQPPMPESEQQFMRVHKNSVVSWFDNTSSTLARTWVCRLFTSMLRLGPTGERNFWNCIYVRRHHEQGHSAGNSSSTDVEYYQQKHSECDLARGPADQGGTSDRLWDALCRHCCFLLSSSICSETSGKMQHSGRSEVPYCMILLFTEDFHEWRRCFLQYLDKPPDDAKTKLVRIFYGETPRVHASFLLKLCDEVQKAAESIFGVSWLWADRAASIGAAFTLVEGTPNSLVSPPSRPLMKKSCCGR